MSLAFTPKLKRQLADVGVIAVVVSNDEKQAGPLADALMAGGVSAVELALRTPRSLEVLKAMKRHAPAMLVGAGTVILPEQVRQVQDAGADFAVAPGTNRRVLDCADAAGLPFGPGVVTPSDIETALEFGCNVLKFFPAEPSGGLAYLRNMIAPYLHLGIQFIPLGGLRCDNIAPYAEDPNILALGGSWIAPGALIAEGNWASITDRARETMHAIGKTPSLHPLYL